MHMRRIAFVLADVISVDSFLQEQIVEICKTDAEVWTLCNKADESSIKPTEKCKLKPIRIAREINLYRDIMAISRLVFILLFKTRPQVLVASTPKGGLLGIISATLAGVKRRIYHVRGIRYETTSGLKKLLLIYCERTACWLAHEVVSNSFSMRERLIDDNVVKASKIHVIGHGSAKGVDLLRFCPDKIKLEQVNYIRTSLGIPSSSIILGFAGRLTRDKGIDEAVRTFVELVEEGYDIHLLVMGSRELGDSPSKDTLEALNTHPKIHCVGHITDTHNYYAAFDIMLFPSYREGLPNALLEASAMKLPVVAFKATGTVDVIVHGVSGTLVTVGDFVKFKRAVREYLNNSSLREMHGLAGRKHVIDRFDQKVVIDNWVKYITGERIATDCQESAEGASIDYAKSA